MKTPYYQLFLIFLFIFSSLVSLAQNRSTTQGRISGTLQDNRTKEPIGFANVVLLTATDSSLVTGATTELNGQFTLAPVPAGKYTIRVSMVGYPTKFIPNVVVSASSPSLELGTITISAGATNLAEVEVVTERELVEYNLDKRVVNVSKDIAAQSGTVAEVMQNIPSVEVDIEGNVSLRGSGNVTVLIDGKRTAMSNLTMDQIPANMIESIELITNPSSKYNPEGTSGIINLVLKKEKRPGFNGSATVNAGTYDNYNASVNLSYRYYKWSLNGGYDFRYRNRPGSGSTSTIFYDTATVDNKMVRTISQYREQARERTSKDISNNFRFGADYYLTPKHTISASTYFRFGRDEGSNILSTRSFDPERNLVSHSTRTNLDYEDELAMDFNLGYRQTFGRKGQELTADLLYSKNVDDELTDYIESDVLKNNDPRLQQTLADDKNNRMVAQADYVHPFSDDSRIEAGFRTSFQRLDNDAKFYDFHENRWVYNTIISNHFVYDELVNALYGNYSNKVNSISFQIGLRAEQTNTKADQITQDTTFNNSYFSLFPSVFVTKDINEDNKVQFSYSRRINRPRSRFLDPFIDLSNKYDIDYGNPQLEPEFINSLELGYLTYIGRSSLNISTFYRHTTNQIQRFRDVITVTELNSEGVEEEYPRTETTFLNLATGQSYGVELGYTYDVTNWWKLNGSVSGFRTELNDTQGNTELSNNQFSWNTKLNSSMNVWKDLDIQLSANYRAPMASIQGRREEMFSADLGVKKDVLNKKGTVLLRVTDIFNTRQFNYTSFGPTFESDSQNRRISRMLYIGFTYRLNTDGAQRDRNRQQDRDQGGEMDDDF